MKRPLIASCVIALVLASLRLAAQPAVPAPRFEVDPYWPRPFPLIKDKDGRLHRWATGEIGGTCIDSHDHIFTLNRSWQQRTLGKLNVFEQQSSVPAPPVVAYDPAGNVAASWGSSSGSRHGSELSKASRPVRARAALGTFPPHPAR